MFWKISYKIWIVPFDWREEKFGIFCKFSRRKVITSFFSFSFSFSRNLMEDGSLERFEIFGEIWKEIICLGFRNEEIRIWTCSIRRCLSVCYRDVLSICEFEIIENRWLRKTLAGNLKAKNLGERELLKSLVCSWRLNFLRKGLRSGGFTVVKKFLWIYYVNCMTPFQISLTL